MIDVLSPDGFSIDPTRIYKDEKEARTYIKQWIERYRRQGYYSSNNGRIPLDQLEDHCTFVPVS